MNLRFSLPLGRLRCAQAGLRWSRAVRVVVGGLVVRLHIAGGQGAHQSAHEGRDSGQLLQLLFLPLLPGDHMGHLEEFDVGVHLEVAVGISRFHQLTVRLAVANHSADRLVDRGAKLQVLLPVVAGSLLRLPNPLQRPIQLCLPERELVEQPALLVLFFRGERLLILSSRCLGDYLLSGRSSLLRLIFGLSLNQFHGDGQILGQGLLQLPGDVELHPRLRGGDDWSELRCRKQGSWYCIHVTVVDFFCSDLVSIITWCRLSRNVRNLTIYRRLLLGNWLL